MRSKLVLAVAAALTAALLLLRSGAPDRAAHPPGVERAIEAASIPTDPVEAGLARVEDERRLAAAEAGIGVSSG